MEMGLWESLLLGVLVIGILMWFGPGAKSALKHSPKGSAEDWRALIFPLGLVVLFVVLLIALA